MSTTTTSPAVSTRPDASWCGLAAFGPDATMTKSVRACPSAAIASAMSAATSRSVRPARSQPGTRACTRSMAAPAARSAAISAGVLRIRSPDSAALASPCRASGRTSRNRSTISAHMRSARPTEDTPAGAEALSRFATSAYGSSVSSQGIISRPRPPAGDAWAAGSSRRGTTRNGAPPAGITRQVSRSSWFAS